jgi:hypothetical protein
MAMLAVHVSSGILLEDSPRVFRLEEVGFPFEVGGEGV